MYLNFAFSTLLVHTLMRKILSISILCTLQLNDRSFVFCIPAATPQPGRYEVLLSSTC